MSEPMLPAASVLDLDQRGVCGRDLQLLRQWYGLTIQDCCYVLGITLPTWYAYQNQPDRLIDDVSVALLVWVLLQYPEAHYLPSFPDPAAVYPLYENACRNSGQTLNDPASAFSLLLGRERNRTAGWLAETGRTSRVPASVRRLLFALRQVLLVQGVPGFTAWVDRVRLEAHSRDLDMDTMTAWRPRKQKAHPSPPTSAEPKPDRPPRRRGRPRQKTPPERGE